MENNNEKKPICLVCSCERIKNYLKKNGYSVEKCQRCGFVFVWPIAQNTRNFYTENYFFKNIKITDPSGYTDYEKDKASMKDVFHRYLDELEKFSMNRKIFDIGAATGYFLDIAKSRGWQTNGNEISRFATQIAEKKGHRVAAGDLTEIEMLPENCGAVTMWDVLEHMGRPVENLIIANKILVPGGILAINTVDRNSLWARLWGRKWQMIVPPEHLCFFNPSDLKILLNRAGFEIIEIKKIGKKYSIPYIIKTFYLWRGGLFWKMMTQCVSAPIWRKFSIPINLRDNVFVIARKYRQL